MTDYKDRILEEDRSAGVVKVVGSLGRGFLQAFPENQMGAEWQLVQR